MALWLYPLANRQNLQQILTYSAIHEDTETMSSWDHKPINGRYKGAFVKYLFIKLTETPDWSKLESFQWYQIPAKFTLGSTCGDYRNLFVCSRVRSRYGPLGVYYSLDLEDYVMSTGFYGNEHTCGPWFQALCLEPFISLHLTGT